MDNLIIPSHQFELRFDPVLNISTIAKEVVGPYVQRTTSINIENAETFNERITLVFNDVNIALWWDRIILSSNIGVEELEKANSVVEEPFFTIVEKLKSYPTFGRIKNSIFYIVGVVSNTLTFNENFTNLSNTYLQPQPIQKLKQDYNDFGLLLQKRHDLQSTSLNFGPYNGLEDFNNRNIKPKQKYVDQLKGISGTFFEFTAVSNLGTQFNLKHYKNLVKEFNSQIIKL